MTFVTFHVDISFNSRPMMDLFFKTLPLHYPHCRKVVLTDPTTKLTFLKKEIEVIRCEVDKSRLALSRLTARLKFMGDHTISDDLVFLDYDILVNGELDTLFKEEFDVAVTYRPVKDMKQD